LPASNSLKATRKSHLPVANAQEKASTKPYFDGLER